MAKDQYAALARGPKDSLPKAVIYAINDADTEISVFKYLVNNVDTGQGGPSHSQRTANVPAHLKSDLREFED